MRIGPEPSTTAFAPGSGCRLVLLLVGAVEVGRRARRTRRRRCPPSCRSARMPHSRARCARESLLPAPSRRRSVRDLRDREKPRRLASRSSVAASSGSARAGAAPCARCCAAWRGTSGRCPSRACSASIAPSPRRSAAHRAPRGARRSARDRLRSLRRRSPSSRRLPSAGRGCATSSERIAFCSAASKVRSIAITSPVAFICVPSARSASGNLSNGQRGILTTHVVQRRLEGGHGLAA